MTIETFSTPGTFDWVCPTGVTSVKVECWGAGAGGQDPGVNQGGGSGGGAYCRKDVHSVTAGNHYQIVVGAGGAHNSNGGYSSFDVSLSERHAGGGFCNVTNGSGGAGGTATGGDVNFSGGAGFHSGFPAVGGGGGGSSAGTAANGNDSTGGAGATAPSGGGNGGDGGDFGNGGNGLAGSTPGGGGGGADFGKVGGAGANGKVVLTYSGGSTIATAVLNCVTTGTFKVGVKRAGRANLNVITTMTVSGKRIRGGRLGIGSITTLIAPNAQKNTIINLSCVTTLTANGSITHQQGMNLFLQSDTQSINSSLFLSLFGSNNSGCFNSITLFAECDGGPSGNLNLFLQGPSSGAQTKSLPLSLTGAGNPLQSAITLFAQNNQSGVFSSITLYASGEGENPGYFPTSGQLNLFIQRIPSSAIPLYLRGEGIQVSGQLTLFTNGSILVGSGLTLAVPKVVGFETEGLKLFTHGW